MSRYFHSVLFGIMVLLLGTLMSSCEEESDACTIKYRLMIDHSGHTEPAYSDGIDLLGVYFPSFGGIYEVYNDIKHSERKPWSIVRIENDGNVWNEGDSFEALHLMGINSIERKSVYQNIIEMSEYSGNETQVFSVTLQLSDELRTVKWLRFPADSNVSKYFGDRSKYTDELYETWMYILSGGKIPSHKNHQSAI